MKCLNICLRSSKTYDINGKKFYKVKTIGEGGYSFVIEVRDKVNQRYALVSILVVPILTDFCIFL